MQRDYRTVPISQIALHPANANQMDARTKDRIKRHIRESSWYPTTVVRALEATREFTELRDKGMFQMLDGEHRLEMAREDGHETIDVEILHNISDDRALVLLATLNDGGEWEPKKRAELVTKILHATGEDPEELQKYLQETADDIQRYAKIGQHVIEKQVTFTATEGKKREKSTGVSFTVFLENKAAEKEIREEIAKWLAKNDPSGTMPFREGVALLNIVRGS